MSKPSAIQKMQAFARAVASGASGPDALVAAGYKPGKSGKGSAALASRMMKHPVVQAELATLAQADRKIAIAKRRECLELLTQHVRANITDYMHADGRLDMAAVKAAGKASGVKRVRVTKNTKTDKNGDEYTTENLEIEMQCQHGAIDRLARLLGWNKPERVDVSHNLNLATLSDAEIEAQVVAIAAAKVKRPARK